MRRRSCITTVCGAGCRPVGGMKQYDEAGIGGVSGRSAVDGTIGGSVGSSEHDVVGVLVSFVPVTVDIGVGGVGKGGGIGAGSDDDAIGAIASTSPTVTAPITRFAQDVYPAVVIRPSATANRRYLVPARVVERVPREQPKVPIVRVRIVHAQLQLALVQVRHLAVVRRRLGATGTSQPKAV